MKLSTCCLEQSIDCHVSETTSCYWKCSKCGNRCLVEDSSQDQPQEMTLEEIEKELGTKIKIK